MSIPYSGTVKRSAGIISALAKEVRQLNLKAVKKISVKFDPFGKNVTPTRSLLHYLTGPRVVETNANCLIKTEVVCNRADPLVTFNLLSGENIIFKSKNLSTLQLLQLCNKHISCLAPKEDPAEEVATKSKQKKPAGKKR